MLEFAASMRDRIINQLKASSYEGKELIRGLGGCFLLFTSYFPYVFLCFKCQYILIALIV